MKKKDNKPKLNKKNNKKLIICTICVALVILSCIVFMTYNNATKNTINTETEKLEALPKPEITGGVRGELGIDKNINEKTIDRYLNRKDAVYRDMRMLEDPGNYEAIGGDRFLSGYIKGFEVVPLPYIVPVTGLPSEVGNTYTGTTLFYNDNGTFVANYEESMDIIEKLFPKDKVIFLMCGGGGYAGQMKNFLVSLGWDENKIYNTGGYWYYEGKNSINIKKEVDGKVTYDFDKVPYHDIKFDKLTKSENYKAPIVNVSDVKLNTTNIKLEEGASFQLNAIVLPNEATNKSVVWSSSNTSVATVTSDGLVKGAGAGAASISVETIDGNKKVLCSVTVNKKTVSTRIKIDDVSKEAHELEQWNISKVDKDFNDIINNPDTKELYFDENGYTTDLGRKEYNKFENNRKTYLQKRVEIVNSLVDNKKSFIMLIHNKECEVRDYPIVDNAAKILKQNGYTYIDVGTLTSDGDEILEKSKIRSDNIIYYGNPLAIFKEGKFYAMIDLNKESIKNDAELKNWLSKYIDI